jgi:predicted metal-dependent hydrolase
VDPEKARFLKLDLENLEFTEEFHSITFLSRRAFGRIRPKDGSHFHISVGLDLRRRRHDLAFNFSAPAGVLSGRPSAYLGRQYRLRVASEASRRPSVSLQGAWLRIGVPRGLQGPERAAAVQQALVGWYRLHAAERLPERVTVWSERFGIAAPTVLIREQTKRWASCDPEGVLRFNWRIIQASMRLVDYVVAHELVHLSHREHTRDLWSALGKAMPDYEGRRAQLRLTGALLFH